jgi:excinuclease UvrABC ATPase subunit
MSKVGGDGIRIVGARDNNLKDVSLTLPRDRITVFVGVSGSGRSSIVFDTVAVEAQRQLNATFPWFIRNQLPKYERPHVAAVEKPAASTFSTSRRPGCTCLTSARAAARSRELADLEYLRRHQSA